MTTFILTMLVKDNYIRLMGQMKKLKDENEDLHGRYKEKADKLNDAKQVLQESYDEALRLDTMIKMYPDKTKMFQMSQELLGLKEKIQNRNEFEMVRDFLQMKWNLLLGFSKIQGCSANSYDANSYGLANSYGFSGTNLN